MAVVAICGSFTPLQRCGAFTLFDRFKICDVGQKERLLLSPAAMGVVTMILNTSQLSFFCLNYIENRDALLGKAVAAQGARARAFYNQT